MVKRRFLGLTFPVSLVLAVAVTGYLLDGTVHRAPVRATAAVSAAQPSAATATPSETTSATTATVASASPSAPESGSSIPRKNPPNTASELATLRIAADGTMTGYSRKLFPNWVPATTDLGWPAEVAGCNTRWATLWRDGTGLSWKDQANCIMADQGGWYDTYGTELPNGQVDYLSLSGDPGLFQIDHIVPLADAWRTGASSWTTAMRTRIANDPDNLATALNKVNESKGDQSADTYLPPGTFRCEYVRRYTLVKWRYDLTVTKAEHDALAAAAGKCNL